MRKRNAAEMRADTDDHKPLVMALLDARRIRLWIRQAGYINFLRLLNLLLRSMEDEDRLGAPEYLDDLRVGRDGGRVRIHLGDERDEDRRSPHRADGAGGDVKKVAARVLRRRHGRHVFSPLLRWLVHPARGWNPGPVSEGRRGGPVAATLEKAGQRVGGVLLAPLP